MASDDRVAKIAVARRLYEEALDQHRLEVADEILTAAFVDHVPVDVPPGPKGFQELGKIIMTAFPDVRVKVDDLFVAGDNVVARITMRGTHQGPFQGVPATGKPVSWTSIQVLRMEDGRIAERWAEGNLLGVMRQIGALPTPPAVVR